MSKALSPVIVHVRVPGGNGARPVEEKKQMQSSSWPPASVYVISRNPGPAGFSDLPKAMQPATRAPGLDMPVQMCPSPTPLQL